MEPNIDVMRELVDKLNYYTKLYDEGHPIISDKEWDNLYFELKDLEERFHIILANSPTNKIHYTIVDNLQKVRHNHQMLSLDKTKDRNAIANFLGKEDGIAMLKMDGLTCSITYDNGKLIKAETRGDGIIGEDITHNIHFVKGVLSEIPIKDTVTIDGEVICTYADFEEFNQEYKNPRNFASGSIRLLDSKTSADRHLSFIAWDCVQGLKCKTLSEKLLQLESIGFLSVPFLRVTKDKIDHAIVLLQRWAQDEGYPIDGIVFKYDDCAYYQSLGATNHHFRGGLALKFYDETYSTKLKSIDWTMGRTGQLTPIAVFEPVEIDGTIVERASLHNVSVMRETLGECAYLGEPLEIYKANQIIPQIYSAGPKYDYETIVAKGGVSVGYIEKCPICGAEVEFKRDGIAEICYCSNPDCEGRLINKLDHFCGKKGLDIKGLSKATLEKLIDWGWVENFLDIYHLDIHKKEWTTKQGFGVASVDKILKAIEDSKDTELWKVIAAAGIPFIGIAASKILANYYITWQAFRAAIDKNEDFSHLPDFGMVMNEKIHKYDFTIMDEVVQYLRFAETVQPDRHGLDGLHFCITGKVYEWKNRDSLKEYIESLGGKVTGSVTSKTNYLINNDIESTTAKNKTAKQLNIPILTEKDFIALIDDLLEK